jgi:tetratricopeptide (TPR) repeat protein
MEPPPAPGAESARAGDGLRRAGRTEEARLEYRRALERDPGNVRAHLGLQAIGLERGLDLSLRREYRASGPPHLAARLEADPRRQQEAYAGSPEPWRSLGLGDVALREGSLGPGTELCGRAAALDPGNALVRIGLGRAHLAAGATGLADAEFRAAMWSDPGHPAPPLGLSLLADRRGSLADAFRWALEAYARAPAEASLAARVREVAARSGRADWMAQAGQLLAEHGGGDADILLAAGSLLRDGGSPAAARDAWERAQQAGATPEEVAARAAGGPAPEAREFVLSLAAGVEARYRHYAATKEKEDFGEFVAWARALWEAKTGETLGPRGGTVEFAFVGKLVDPSLGSDEPLVRACARRGMLLVLGQRRGGPPEALLADVVRREPLAPVRVRGTEVEREVVWTGQRHLSGYQEWGGAGDIAGLALDRLVIVDLHAVAAWEGSLRRDRARLLPHRAEVLGEPALEDRPVTSVDDPAGVDRRLLLDAGIDVAAEVLVHENAHLVDAARHLPVGSHPLRNFGLALRRGFGAEEILAYLERNAQLCAITEGPGPRAALAACCAALGGHGAHATGYREIVEGIVAEIHANPARYPAIDQGRVIVQQLHVLGDEEVRAAARELARRWGTDG